MQNEAQEVRIYKVRDIRMADLNVRIAKLNKAAAKLGVTPVVVNKIGEELLREMVTDDDYMNNQPPRFRKDGYVLASNERFTGRVAIVNLLTVTGNTPKLAGWSFIGKIELVKDEEGKTVGNLLRLVPDAVAPAEYRNTNPWCDHCNVNRRWAETFIIRHESGIHKQVGRRCIADFLGGVDPNAIAASAEYLLNVDAVMGDEEGFDFEGGYGRGVVSYDVESLLRMTACHIRKDGWMSKGKAMMLTGAAFTSGDVISHIEARTEKELKPWRDHIVNEADEKTAAETIEWLDSISSNETNEYLYSLSLLGRAGLVKSNQVGLLCSAIPAMLRDKEKELNRKQRAEAHRQSEHIGEVKQRLVFTGLKIEFIRHIESAFGATTLYTFVDLNNNVIKWFASNEIRVDGRDAAVGDVVTLKATIKDHGVYNGIKDTQITRAKLVEDAKPEAAAVVLAESPIFA